MHGTAAVVEFNSVTKSFDGHRVLHDISLNLATDAVTAIVGESGSGKSTLLEHINGLHQPDSGSVSVLGAAIDYAGIDQLRRQIGYAVQGVGLSPHLTAADNVELLAKLSGWDDNALPIADCT